MAGPKGYLAALRLEEVFSLSDFRTVTRQESLHNGPPHLDEPTPPTTGDDAASICGIRQQPSSLHAFSRTEARSTTGAPEQCPNLT